VGSRDRIRNAAFSSYITNGPQTRAFVLWQAFPTLAHGAYLKVTKKIKCSENGPGITFKWRINMYSLVSDKLSSLLFLTVLQRRASTAYSNIRE
jgi:hypothetical protein